jgi:outer membrane protein OmpA-like peptidoglycan-associated protein
MVIKNGSMKYVIQIFMLSFLIACMESQAQENVSIRKKEFKTDNPGFDEAWKHVTEGDSYYSKGGVWYANAFDEYLLAVVYNSSNAELNYKTGVSALFSDRREEASGFLLKAFELKKYVAQDIVVLTGRALQYVEKYPEAIEKFNTFLASPGLNSEKNIALAKRCIEECNSAVILTKDTLRIAIDNLGSGVNSNADDYSEVFTNDGKTLYFASRREISKSSHRLPDTKFDENILVAQQNNGKWDSALVAGKEITTGFCETPLFITKGGDTLYIYSGFEKGGKIKMSVKKEGEWKAAQQIPYSLSSNGSESSFCISPSGKEIYFVSDNGKNHKGGRDIYIIKKLNKRRWSKPANAGNLINTSLDEESVRFSGTGDTLWFSSKGHNSIGGFDIFYSIKNKAGEWDTVKNCGYPVNTQWDELFYYPSPVNDSVFYFVSNRSGGFGGLDIYRGRLLPPKPVLLPVPEPEPVIIPPAPVKTDTVVVVKEVVTVVQPEPVKEMILYLAGKITDSETGAAVLAKIDVIDIDSNVILATTASSDVDGSFRVRLPEKKSYLIDLRATGFLSDMKRITIPGDYSQEVYNLNVSLGKVKVGKKVVLNNILFETGKSILTSGSNMELDRLVNIMQDNAQMKIEISGHTDKTGSEPLNFKLSEDRAKAVVEYLVQKGIERSRMEFRGFGSLQPIADNTTAAGRSKNRRVEFKILEF